MRWPWSRLTRDMIRPFVEAPPDHEAALDEARCAREVSETGLEQAHVKRDELHEVTESLRHQRAANRFAERMGQSFRSQRQ